MADQAKLYDAGVAAFFQRDMSWDGGDTTYRAYLMKSGYKFSRSHTLADITKFINGTTDPLSTSSDGTQGYAEAAHVLADSEAQCNKIVVCSSSRVPVACSPIDTVTPLKGQRVDLSWPGGLVFDLYPAD